MGARLMKKKAPQKSVGQSDVKYQQVVNPNIAPSRHRASFISTTGVAERDMTRWNRETAMAQARLLAESNSFIKGIVIQKVDNEVSTGFNLKMRTNDRGFNKEVEAQFNAEKDEFDIRGIRTWRKLISAIDWRKTIDGDVGIAHNFTDPVTGAFRVQLIEADRIHSKKFDYLDQGCEFDDYGRPLRYFVSPRPKDQQDFKAQYADGTAFDAADFHLCAHYSTERIDMLRGTSMLLPMFNKLVDVEEIMDAYLQKVKNAAMMVWKSTLEQQLDGVGVKWTADDAGEVKTQEDGGKRKQYRLVAGSKIDLAQGENLEVLESKEPNAVVEPFLKFMLRYLGAGIAMPLEYMLLDLNALNYSSARALFEMAHRRFRCEQESLTTPATKIFKSWLKYKVNGGEIEVPSSIINPFAHAWGLPSWPYIDPQKEIQANGMALGFGLTSRKRILAETGEDWDEVAEELAQEQKDITEKNLAITIGLPGAKQSGEPVSQVEQQAQTGEAERISEDIKA